MRAITAALMTSLLAFSPLSAQVIAPPTSSERANIDARSIARFLADRLVSDYVYPERGQQYAAMLRANADAGVYNALNGVELATRLGTDLQKTAPDGHLRVMFDGQGGGGGMIVVKRSPNEAGGPPTPDAKPVTVRMEPPPVMEHAGWIAPGIAYVRFNLFPGTPEAVAAARIFMATHRKAKTIIFDVRTHMGGGLGEMDAIFPWLFAQPTRLVAMATRKSVDDASMSPIADVPSLRIVPADPNFVTREHWVRPGMDKSLRRAKVYLLTSSFSASAAEHFALAFKHSGRATIIGRTTYGANHFGGDQDLGGLFTAFIPVGRAYDPKTGEDWEGRGISPDIDVPAKDALIKALTLSGVAADKAAELSDKVAPQSHFATMMERERVAAAPKS
jgi:C-terminal processing protease CtpA/Prc